jgi:hypothetical protein
MGIPVEIIPSTLGSTYQNGAPQVNERQSRQSLLVHTNNHPMANIK